MARFQQRPLWLTLALVVALMASFGPKPLVARAGTVYYVATNGDDGNDGTDLGHPWRTLQKAADTVQPGDAVYVRGGDYTESVRFTHSGVEGSPITFQNYPGETPTFQATGWVGFHLNADWVVMDGFHVCGATSHGIFISNAHHNVVQNCEFNGNGWAGVQFGGDDGPATNNTICNCDVHDNIHEGVYLRGAPNVSVIMSNNIIEYNDIHHNGAEGIQNTFTYRSPDPEGTIIRDNRVYENGGDWGGGMCLAGNNLLVENNIVHNNGGSVGGIWFSTDDPGGCNDGVIRNNLIYNNHGTWSYGAAGIHVYKGYNIQVYHNTIYGNTGNPTMYGIFLRDSEAVAQNNILSQNNDQLRIGGGASTEDHNLIDGASTVQGVDDVYGDPLFVDAANADFRLQDTSPAVDAGVDVGVTVDIEGTSRPQGYGYDIGAYEYAGEPPTPTVTVVPTDTEEPTLTPTPTDTEEPTLTPTPTDTEEPTITPTPTFTEEPTLTPTPTDTIEPTITPTPTFTEEPTITPTPTFTEEPTLTPTPTDMPEATPTVTSTPTRTVRPSMTPKPTKTPKPTNTPRPPGPRH